MCFEIPLTAAIISVALVVNSQLRRISAKERYELQKLQSAMLEAERKFSELEDYKKRVDALTLRAGFKL